MLLALSVGSRRLPGNYPARYFAQRGGLMASIQTQPLELQRVEPFPGAACCQPIELASCKAAPLQLGVRDTAV
jgi:hypothetical protein